MPELRQRIAELKASVTRKKAYIIELEGWAVDKDVRIAELKSAYDHTVEDNVDLVRQLDAMTEQMDWIKKHHHQVYMMATQEAGE